MSTKKIINNLSLILIVILTILCITISYCSPYFPDDYNYAFVFNSNTRIDSFSDLFRSVGIFYLHWGGRFLPQLIGQLLIWFGKPWFSVLNGLMLLTLSYFIYKSCFSSKDEKINFSKILFIFLVIILTVPIPNETLFWQMGSINYMWMMALSVIYICPFILAFLSIREIEDNYKTYTYVIIFGFLAGLTNENIAPFIVFANIVYIVYKFIIKEHIYKWNILGLISSIVGCCLLMLSPGNSERQAIETQAYGIPDSLSVKYNNFFLPTLEDVFSNHYKLLLKLLIITFIAYIIFKGVKNKHFVLSVLLTLAAIFSNLIMLFPSTYSQRSAFGGSIFMIMAMALLLSQLKFNVKLNNIIYIVSFLIFTIISVKIFVPTTKIALDYNSLNQSRVDYVLEKKSENILDLHVKSITMPANKYLSLYDITNDSNSIYNRMFCRYYEINSITTFD